MSDDQKSSSNLKLFGGIAAVVGASAAALAYVAFSSEQKAKAAAKKAASAAKQEEKRASKAVAARAQAAAAAATPVPKVVTPASPAVSAVVEEVTEESKIAGSELGREGLVNMFTFIVNGMDALIFKLAREERQLRMQGADKDKMLADLSHSYQESMQALQVEAFRKYDTDEVQAETAIKKYEQDPEFKAIRARMDLINNALMGGVPPADPDMLEKMPAWLTVDKVIEVFTTMMESMTQSMVESVEEVSKQHEGPPPHEEINARYYEKISIVKDAVLGRFDLDEKMLDVAMLKYANDPALANVMIELQSKQEKTFDELRAKVASNAR